MELPVKSPLGWQRLAARASADRVAELSALINAEREVKALASLAHEKERQRAFATEGAEIGPEVVAEREQLDKVTCQADELSRRQ